MYLNGKKIFATINNKRTLPIVSGSGEEPYTEVRITLTEDTGKTLSFRFGGREYTVDWGDGVTESFNIHTYDDYGDYTLKIYGEINGDDDHYGFFVSGKNAIKSVRFFANALRDGGLYECGELDRVEFSGLETTIPYGSFWKSGLRTVTIPDRVQTIENHAFRECYRLTSVFLGKQVRVISDDAFWDCRNLTSINLNAVTSIGENAFSGCSFSSIDIGRVRQLGQGAFSVCRSLTNVTLPSGVTSIPQHCFYNCENLVLVDLPTSIEYIGRRCFEGASCDIYYNGTRERWEAIEKSSEWWYGVNTVHCIDD